MRVVLIVVLLAGCAGSQLASAPPSGVDLSGRWQLNEADSDDPQRLSSQPAGPGAAGTGGQDGPGGRGGGRGGRGRGGGGGGGGMGTGGTVAAPPLPPVGTMSEGLRWPGKEVEIKQVAGVVAITSAGVSQVYQPAVQAHPGHRKPAAADDAPRDRDMRSFERGDGPPPICGWDGKTLVVQSRDADEDHPPFEERYSLSDDGQRLIEVVGFRGGRSAGFTMFRVWDRSAPP